MKEENTETGRRPNRMDTSGAGIPLRPHHGMCLAYYQGKGYSPAFTQAADALLLRLTEENPVVRLTMAADVMCAACPNRRGNECDGTGNASRYDRAVLERCGLREGDELPFLTFTAAVQSRILAPGGRAAICGGCQWNELCSGPGRWTELKAE
ncbi:MAG: DUF1284 domain-containing protein [Clostridiales bacterium]|nr:DUF1284 domain-containing protein [Clostridiales bacterium]